MLKVNTELARMYQTIFRLLMINELQE